MSSHMSDAHRQAMAALGYSPEQVSRFADAFRNLALEALPPDMHEFASLEALFLQKNPTFPEGCTPAIWTLRGKAINILLKALLGLSANPEDKFVVRMDGCELAAAGWYPFVPDLVDWRASRIAQVIKGDAFNPGKVGANGGNCDGEDEGWPLQTIRRENAEEIGIVLPFGRYLDYKLGIGWRTHHDTRMEAFSLWCAALVTPTTLEEASRWMEQAFPKAGEIRSFAFYPLADIAEFIRTEKANFPENRYLLASLCCTLRFYAMASSLLEGTPVSDDAEVLLNLARGMGEKVFRRIVFADNAPKPVENWHKGFSLDRIDELAG